MNNMENVAIKDELENEDELLNQIKDVLHKARTYTPKVGVFGNSGVGKSSLCNALFGKEIAKISDVEACTREPQEILIGDAKKGGIVLVDVPGVGEDPEHHKEYIELYKSLSTKLDLVIWAIKSDDRNYASAIQAYKDVLEPNLKKCPVVFVITQADKIKPDFDWDRMNNKPSEKQLANLGLKANDISARFDVSTNKIISISADYPYNLVELVNKVVEVLPNEKKYGFTRETKEENVSEEAAIKAEKGIFDHVKEVVGDAFEVVKDVVVATIVKSAPKIIKSIGSWVKSWF